MALRDGMYLQDDELRLLRWLDENGGGRGSTPVKAAAIPPGFAPETLVELVGEGMVYFEMGYGAGYRLTHLGQRQLGDERRREERQAQPSARLLTRLTRWWRRVSGAESRDIGAKYRAIHTVNCEIADMRAREAAEEIAARLAKETGRPHYAHRLTDGVWEPRPVAREGVAERQADRFEEWVRNQDGGPVSRG